MLNLREIHKPKTLNDALDLLAQPETVALAGGTALISERRKDVRAVVDLNELGLSYIREQDNAIVMGSTTRLAEIVRSSRIRDAGNGIVAQAAQLSHAGILRNQATIMGTLLVEPAGPLAAALGALDAQVMFVTGAPEHSEGQIPLIDFLRVPAAFLKGGIATAVIIPIHSIKRRSALETVGRTPRDKPIVSVCAALEIENGSVRAGGVALGGVDVAVVRAVEAEHLLLNARVTDDLIERAVTVAVHVLTPPSDFRGSATYRREMARVLTRRALRAVPE